MSGPGVEITRLIQEWRAGDLRAENQLFDALCSKLHQIAVHYMRTEPQGQSLGPTALVHEAYMRFRASTCLQINDRSHFLSLAARVMRRILVDRAKKRLSQRQGGGAFRTELTDDVVTEERDAIQILLVDRALTDFAKRSPVQCRIVELIYFGGYSKEDCAAALACSPRTVQRQWQVARTRLASIIDGTEKTG